MPQRFRRGATIFAAVVAISATGRADPTLDPDFRPAVTTTRESLLYAVAVQRDGKSLIAGDFSLVNGVPRRGVARLKPDGSLDLTFDAGLGADGSIYAAAVQDSDGKILLAGQFYAFNGAPRTSLVRLLPDGAVDETFHPILEGEAGWIVSALVIEPGGRILLGGNFSGVGGMSRSGVARLTPDGQLDRTFQPGSGLEGGTAHDLALQEDGRIVVAGTFERLDGKERLGLARLMPDGHLDDSFAPSAFSGAQPGQVYAVSVHAVHGIAVAGVFDRIDEQPRMGIAWLGFDGQVAGDYDPLGGLQGDRAAPYDLVSLPDGKLLVTGSFWYAGGAERAGLAQLNLDGTADSLFEPTGGLAAQGTAFGNMLAMQPDGGFLVAGQFEEAGGVRRHCLARFRPDGSIDPEFSSTNAYLELGGQVEAITPLASGSLLVGGDFERVNGVWRHGLAKLDAGGQLEPNFDAKLNPGAVVRSIVEQPDGRILIGGWFDHVRGSERTDLARLLPDGSLDETFAAHATDAAVRAIALQPDGRILVGGDFRQFGEWRRFGLVRLEPTGEVDADFEPRFEIGLDRAGVLALTLQADGRILAGGRFDSVNGQPRRGLVRLGTEGSIDESFKGQPSDGDAIPTVTCLLSRSDGRLWVGGEFSAVAGRIRNGIARLYSDGVLDASFDSGTGIGGPSDASVHALALLPQGQVAVGGWFQSYNGVRASQLAVVGRNLGPMPASLIPTGIDGPVRALAAKGQARLLVGGAFARVLGQDRFGLALVNVPPTATHAGIRLAIVIEEGRPQVHWDGEGRLQEAGGLPGSWHEVTGVVSPYVPDALSDNRFYRLVESE